MMIHPLPGRVLTVPTFPVLVISIGVSKKPLSVIQVGTRHVAVTIQCNQFAYTGSNVLPRGRITVTPVYGIRIPLTSPGSFDYG